MMEHLLNRPPASRTEGDGTLFPLLLLSFCIGLGVLSGLLFVCIGLFRVTRKLGLFDSTIYGSKRLFGKTKQDFVEYVQDHPYTQNFAEILLLGVGFILLSFLF